MPDHEGIDLGIKHWNKENGLPAGSQIEVQLKATGQQGLLKKKYVSQPLSREHYDALRTPKVSVPRFLVVTVVPTDCEEWLDQTEERLQMLRCSYWLSLSGMDEIEGKSKTVRVPRDNVFDVDGLCRLLHAARPDIELGA